MRTRLALSVKPGSKQPGIENTADGFVLRVRARALEGAANEACIEALADYLDVAPSHITLVRGAQSRHKLFEVDGLESDVVEARLRGKCRKGSQPQSR